jgi:hypothetical protein
MAVLLFGVVTAMSVSNVNRIGIIAITRTSISGSLTSPFPAGNYSPLLWRYVICSASQGQFIPFLNICVHLYHLRTRCITSGRNPLSLNSTIRAEHHALCDKMLGERQAIQHAE